jgi:hypothetical protein
LTAGGGRITKRGLSMGVIMRKTLLIPASVLTLILAVGAAWAVTPPSAKERSESSTGKYTWSDLKPGKKAHTKSGRLCECGVSSTNENECYEPKDGQYCCNPKTGKCYMREFGKVNTPWK